MSETQDMQIEHFPDRSLRRLLQDKEYVRGLVQIVAEVIRYFVQLIFHRRSLDERDALVDIIRQHIQDDKELETMAQTTAEFLIEQGEAKGKAEGKQDAILKLLQFKFQNVPEVLSREISNIHNLTRLDTLLEQAMTAQSLDEIDTHSSVNAN